MNEIKEIREYNLCSQCNTIKPIRKFRVSKVQNNKRYRKNLCNQCDGKNRRESGYYKTEKYRDQKKRYRELIKNGYELADTFFVSIYKNSSGKIKLKISEVDYERS